METRRSAVLGRAVGMAGLVGLLAAGCGGGGGGSLPPGSVDVTAANQDTLSRAGMVALQAGVLGGTAGVASGGAPVARVALAGRKRVAAVQAPEVENCTVSGTTTTVYDDRDDSLSPTAGDVATITYNDCVEVAGEVMSGTIVATFTQIQLATFPATIGASVTTSALRTQTATASVTARGGFAMLLRVDSLTADSLRISVPNAFALTISTPLYSDTVTLRADYVLDTDYDGLAVPPGGTIAGRATSTASGTVESAAAAGTVRVNTLQPFVQYIVDPYPRSGQFEVVGKTGSLQAVVLSSSQVQVALDADGNGVFEATKIVAWSDFF